MKILYKDKTGRGIKNTFSLSHGKKYFKDIENYDGVLFEDWITDATIGDEFENSS